MQVGDVLFWSRSIANFSCKFLDRANCLLSLCTVWTSKIDFHFHYLFFIHGNPVGKGRFSGGREENLKSKI